VNNRYQNKDKKKYIKPLVMPNKKFLLEQYKDKINDKEINLEKTDIFTFEFMEEPYKVYVSMNYQGTAFLVNVQSLNGKLIHHSILELKDSVNTKVAASIVFDKIFSVEEINI